MSNERRSLLRAALQGALTQFNSAPNDLDDQEYEVSIQIGRLLRRYRREDEQKDTPIVHSQSEGGK